MYKVLNGDYEWQDGYYENTAEAINMALHLNQEEDKPYYIADEQNNLLRLILGGSVWLPSPDKRLHYIDKLD